MKHRHSRIGSLVGATAFLVAFAASPQAGTTVYYGTVVSTVGTAPVNPATRCSIVVQQTVSGQYNCRIQISCGGVEIFGAGSAGYENCSFQSVETGIIFHGSATTVTARDPNPSFRDGDPELNLSLPAGPVLIGDGVDAAHVWAVRIGQTRQR